MLKPILLVAKTLVSYQGQQYGENQQFYADPPAAEAFVARGEAAPVEEQKAEPARVVAKS